MLEVGEESPPTTVMKQRGKETKAHQFKRVASCDDDTYFINKQVFGLFFRSTYRIFATYDIQYAHPLDMGG